MAESPADRLRANITAFSVVLVTGCSLALLFLPGVGSLWLPAVLVGYLVVVPLVALIFGDEAVDTEGGCHESGPAHHPQSPDSTTPTGDRQTGDALETLRTRYAAGELTDEQFERKLERLLEVETLEDAERWQARRDKSTPERDLEYER